MVKIKVSTKWLKKKFKCDKDMIQQHCKGKCCKGFNKVLICLLSEETKKLKDKFKKCKIENNKIIGIRNECFFKDINGLCKLHDTPYKPLGCIFSPFKINKNKTLIIRHRYIRFPCFNHKDGKFAYITFKDSLIKIFGNKKYNYIKKKIEEDNGNFYIDIDKDMLDKINILEDMKNG